MLARIDERFDRALDERVEHLAEPAGLRVGDPLAKDPQGRRRAFEEPEVVSRGCCGAGPPRVPAPPRSRARSPCGSPGDLRGHLARSEPSPGSRGRARGDRSRARSARASARSAVWIAFSKLPWRASMAATPVSAPTSAGEGPSGSSSSSASGGSVHCRGSPSRANTLVSVAHRAGGGGDRRLDRCGTTRPLPPGPRPPRCSVRPGKRPHRSGRAPRGVRGVLRGRGRAPVRGSKGPRRCRGRVPALRPAIGT